MQATRGNPCVTMHTNRSKVLPYFLGCVDKLCYVDHDVKDRDKFPNLSNKYTWREKGSVRQEYQY
jgi:hypothetical protein